MTTDTSATIRPRRDTDLPSLGRVLEQVYRKDGYPVEGVADPIAWLQSDQMLGAWVGELNGEIVGHVALVRATEEDDAARMWLAQDSSHLASIAVLCRLFVAVGARGHHLGRELTDTATRHAQSLGKRAVLDVMVKDRSAIRTYQGLGWQELGPIEHRFADDQIEPAIAYVSPNPETSP